MRDNEICFLGVEWFCENQPQVSNAKMELFIYDLIERKKEYPCKSMDILFKESWEWVVS